MATYNNKLTPIARTRILADRNLVLKNKDELADSNIYFDYNKSIVDNRFKILILGSNEINNPYFGGFFLFGGKFSDQYPFYPPYIRALTQGENIRFHPNFYVNGKCCLSILGTWSGPPWTSCQNISSVAYTLKSLYIDNPITQEPSWENCKDYRSEIYSRIISYMTLKIAVLGMLRKPPENTSQFIPVMKKLFIQFYPMYIKKIDSMMKLDKKVETSPIYGMFITYDIIKLKTDFTAMYSKINTE